MKTSTFRTITPRKVIGSLVLAAALAVGIFGTAAASQAFFIGTNRNLVFDGTVGSVSSDSVTVYTTGTDPIVLKINRRTHVGGGLDNLQPGDAVKVVAQRNGSTYTAQLISRPSGATGYGTAGDPVLVSRGTVVSAGSDSFVVKLDGGLQVTFHVNGSTRFIPGSLDDLTTGEHVVVFGNDSGTSTGGFVARTVFGSRR